MGSFSGTTMKSLTIGIPLIVAGLLILFLMRYRMDALSLSEDEARSLGINLPLTRGLIIFAASAITASVVALCGVIGWVGLLIPHIVRMIFGNSNARVVPGSMLTWAIFMLLTDTVARCASAAEIPVSILTAVIGAPVFILLLRKTGGIQA
jgi:iron complex transport system permease protein